MKKRVLILAVLLYTSIYVFGVERLNAGSYSSEFRYVRFNCYDDISLRITDKSNVVIILRFNDVNTMLKSASIVKKIIENNGVDTVYDMLAFFDKEHIRYDYKQYDSGKDYYVDAQAFVDEYLVSKYGIANIKAVPQETKPQTGGGKQDDFAEKAPMGEWSYNGAVFNGRKFSGEGSVSESYNEQDGYAYIEGFGKLHYWLYDTVKYHNGDSKDIYNKYVPKWLENMGYVIDYDNIEVVEPNHILAPPVKSLMKQRGCDVSVALIYNHDYVVINEYLEDKDIYKTTIYPLIK